MNEDYKNETANYRKMTLMCTEQTVNKGTAAFVISKEAFNTDCIKLNDNIYEEVTK